MGDFIDEPFYPYKIDAVWKNQWMSSDARTKFFYTWETISGMCKMYRRADWYFISIFCFHGICAAS